MSVCELDARGRSFDSLAASLFRLPPSFIFMFDNRKKKGKKKKKIKLQCRNKSNSCVLVNPQKEEEEKCTDRSLRSDKGDWIGL